MELGKDIEDSVIEDKISAQKPNQCALLVYTVRTQDLSGCIQKSYTFEELILTIK